MLKSLLVVGTLVATFEACAAYAADGVVETVFDCQSRADVSLNGFDGSTHMFKLAGKARLLRTPGGHKTYDWPFVEVKVRKNPETQVNYCSFDKKASSLAYGLLGDWADKEIAKEGLSID